MNNKNEASLMSGNEKDAPKPKLSVKEMAAKLNNKPDGGVIKAQLPPKTGSEASLHAKQPVPAVKPPVPPRPRAAILPSQAKVEAKKGIYQTFLDFNLASLLDSLSENYGNAVRDDNPIQYFLKGLKLQAIKETIPNIFAEQESIKRQIAQEPDAELRVQLEIKLAQIDRISSGLETLLHATSAATFDALISTLRSIAAQQLEHEYVRHTLLADEANSVMFVIGGGGNPAQLSPSFAQDRDLGIVSIYNFDRAEDKQFVVREEANANVTQRINNLSVFFPNIHTRFGERVISIMDNGVKAKLRSFFEKRLTTPYVKEVHRLLTEQVDQYAKILLAKKQQNPDFKFILLYCCDNWIDPYIQHLVKALESKFSLGKDLKLIHTYEEGTPAVVYTKLGGDLIQQSSLNFRKVYDDKPLDGAVMVRRFEDLTTLGSGRLTLG